MSSRDLILGRVQKALASLPERAPLPDWEKELVVLRAAREAVDLWTLFCERMKAVNGTPLSSLPELVALLESNGWLHGYCDPLLWPRLKDAFPATFTIETDFDRSRVDDYSFGITSAEGAIAETGTLILADRSTSRRLGALAPWTHIAVLQKEQLHRDLPAAVASLPKDPNVIWVTGPSKTADVEGILIEGVHGPGRQIALLLEP